MIAVGLVFIMVFVSSKAAPQNYHTTPVPILKQINRANDDGSYSYGFEAADGTFKIETKYATGEVFGKYGYVGDDGKLRVVEYGASKRGFEPKGSDIMVAPPTLSNSVDDVNPDYDDGEYREDPSIYENQFTAPQNQFSTNRFKKPHTIHRQSQFQQSPVNLIHPVRSNLNVQQIPLNGRGRHVAFQPRLGLPVTPARIAYDPAIFNGHPATNIDINTGSFTVSYTS